MHSQADSAPEQPTAPAAILAAAAGLALYLLTLVVEAVLAASARWALAWLGADALGSLRPLGLSAEQLAWATALLPLALSLLALARPGRGRFFRRRIGARRPSFEEASTLADALALLGAGTEPLTTWVLDAPLPTAAVRGRALLVSRPLIESDALVPVLAHELGHLRSLDGRLTEALARLPLIARQNRCNRGTGGSEDDPRHEALAWTLATGLFRLAAGGIGARLLAPAWAAYWRSREYTADAHAALLGHGIELAEHLHDFEQQLDFPSPALPFDRAEHPPIALRIERLAEAVSQ